MEHRDKVLDAKIEKISDTEIEGYRFSEAWATDQRLFLLYKHLIHLRTCLQSPQILECTGGQKTRLKIYNPNNEPVYIKIGISAVDDEGAEKIWRLKLADKDL